MKVLEAKTYKVHIKYKFCGIFPGVIGNPKANLNDNIVFFSGTEHNRRDYPVVTDVIRCKAKFGENAIFYKLTKNRKELDEDDDHALDFLLKEFFLGKHKWLTNPDFKSWRDYREGKLYFTTKLVATSWCQFIPGGMYW